MDRKPVFSHAVPFMPVRDLKETIAYYRDQLGFSNEWFWYDTDAGIKRDELGLLFRYAPDYIAGINSENEHFEICWFVCNVDEVYEEYKKKGVNIVSQLEPKPWGMKEFTIQDPNGYHIRIGEGIDDAKEN